MQTINLESMVAHEKGMEKLDLCKQCFHQEGISMDVLNFGFEILFFLVSTLVLKSLILKQILVYWYEELEKP